MWLILAKLHCEPVIKARAVFSTGATKWDIRQKVWDYIEDNNLANFPRPVHNRIPNFKVIEQCLQCTTNPVLPFYLAVNQINTLLTNESNMQYYSRHCCDGFHLLIYSIMHFIRTGWCAHCDLLTVCFAWGATLLRTLCSK